jgi:excisionase family DNA binding protein
MNTTEAKILFEGITVEDFFSRLEQHTEKAAPPVASDENFTVEEAAQFLRLSVPTIHRLKAANKIPFKKVGARVIYRKSELIEWLKAK